VTTDLGRASIVQPLFKRFGFEQGELARGRYGTDRHELVLSWRPS
jgi:hypothetical protein